MNTQQQLAALTSACIALTAVPASPAWAQATTAAQTTVWDYISYKRDRTSGQSQRDLGNPGTLELIEADGKARFRIIAGRMDACLRSDVPATVERSAETITITATEMLSGCPLLRYVIRADGSGGHKETQRDGRWFVERFDHGLTAHK
jgi:hypothetical protein